MTGRRTTTWTGLALAGLLLGGCGGAVHEKAQPETGPYAPSAQPRPGMEPLDPPADYSQVDGEGFTISAPAEFQQQWKHSRNGEPMLILERPSSVEGFPERVVVIRDVDPTSPAEEQSYALEVSVGAGAEAPVQSDAPETDDPGPAVLRVALPAPEGQSAFLVTWTEKVAAENGTVDATYWQLFRQVSPDLILNAVALAPTTDFETSEVSRILRTFRSESET